MPEPDGARGPVALCWAPQTTPYSVQQTLLKVNNESYCRHLDKLHKPAQSPLTATVNINTSLPSTYKDRLPEKGYNLKSTSKSQNKNFWLSFKSV